MEIIFMHNQLSLNNLHKLIALPHLKVALYILFFSSCKPSNNESSLSESLIPISDTITIKLDQSIYASSRKNQFFIDENNELNFVYFQKEKRKFKFINIFNPTKIFSVGIYDPLIGLDVWDYYVHKRDSIFFVPDYGSANTKIYLQNELGELVKLYSFPANYFIDSASFTYNPGSSTVMSLYNGVLRFPIGFFNFRVNGNNSIIGDYDSYSHRPNFALLNLNNDSAHGFHYPLHFDNKHKRYHEIISANSDALIFLNWDFTPYISKYVQSENELNFSYLKTLDIKDHVPFNDKNHHIFNSASERLTVSDRIDNMIWDEESKHLFVFYSRGLKVDENESVFVPSFLDKPCYLLVFDENLEFVTNKKFELPEHARGKFLAIIHNNHLILPKNNEFYKRSDLIHLLFFNIDTILQ